MNELKIDEINKLIKKYFFKTEKYVAIQNYYFFLFVFLVQTLLPPKQIKSESHNARDAVYYVGISFGSFIKYNKKKIF